MRRDFFLLPGYERVPVYELLDLFADKPDDYLIRTADGLVDYTAGQLRELAAKGQAIDLPHVRPPKGIWKVEA